MFEWPSPMRSASSRPVADAVRVEERLERLAHHERRQLEVGGLLGCVDHVHRGRDPT